MRTFELALKKENGELVTVKDEKGDERVIFAFPEARLPVYQTKYAAGADFFCAEDVVIPSIWKQVFQGISIGCVSDKKTADIKPTLVHTGVKANMCEDEVLEIVNRSSGPKRGLVLANSIGVIDADYYNNADNDGEIMFAFYNFKLHDVKINAGDRIGQGLFKKVLRPEKGCVVLDVTRKSGIGSTGVK